MASGRGRCTRLPLWDCPISSGLRWQCCWLRSCMGGTSVHAPVASADLGDVWELLGTLQQDAWVSLDKRNTARCVCIPHCYWDAGIAEALLNLFEDASGPEQASHEQTTSDVVAYQCGHSHDRL